MLSAEQVKQFQGLYERRFERQIGEQKAYVSGMDPYPIGGGGEIRTHGTVARTTP